MSPTDIAELRRLWDESAGWTVHWSYNAKVMHAALPALLDELEAARLEIRRQAAVIAYLPDEVAGLHAVIELQREIIAHNDARDRRMKLLGAAEELERLNDNAGSGLVMGDGEFFDGIKAERRDWKNTLTERAAQLRREVVE